MSHIAFENGYYADYSSGIIRLYAPKDMFVCSMPSEETNWQERAEGLMYGFFGGWAEHRRVAKEMIAEALCVDIREAYS